MPLGPATIASEIQPAPVLRPTLAEMQDFPSFLARRAATAAAATGVVIIQPPPEWAPPLPLRDKSRFFVRHQRLPAMPEMDPHTGERRLLDVIRFSSSSETLSLGRYRAESKRRGRCLEQKVFAKRADGVPKVPTSAERLTAFLREKESPSAGENGEDVPVVENKKDGSYQNRADKGSQEPRVVAKIARAGISVPTTDILDDGKVGPDTAIADGTSVAENSCSDGDNVEMGADQLAAIAPSSHKASLERKAANERSPSPEPALSDANMVAEARDMADPTPCGEKRSPRDTLPPTAGLPVSDDVLMKRTCESTDAMTYLAPGAVPLDDCQIGTKMKPPGIDGYNAITLSTFPRTVAEEQSSSPDENITPKASVVDAPVVCGEDLANTFLTKACTPRGSHGREGRVPVEKELACETEKRDVDMKCGDANNVNAGARYDAKRDSYVHVHCPHSDAVRRNPYGSAQGEVEAVKMAGERVFREIVSLGSRDNSLGKERNVGLGSGAEGPSCGRSRDEMYQPIQADKNHTTPEGEPIRRMSTRVTKLLHENPIVDDDYSSESGEDHVRSEFEPEFDLEPDSDKSRSTIVENACETGDGRGHRYVRPTIDEYEEGFWRTLACGVNGAPVDLCYGVDVEAEGAFDWEKASYAEVAAPANCNVPLDKLKTGLSLAQEWEASRDGEISVEPLERNYPGACEQMGAGQTSAPPRWHPGNFNFASVLRHLPRMPGINNPMFYVGQLFTRFCWHVEDGFLNSVSYLHSNSAEKIWYVVPPEYADTFETYAAQEVFAPCLQSGGKTGRALLGNKTTLFDPRDVVKRGIPIYRAVHTAGSFVYTAPRAYHGGFNTGYNVAEAVNFAQCSWLPLGRLASVNMRATRQPMPIPLEFILFREAVGIAECVEKGRYSPVPSSCASSEQLALDARIVALELGRVIEHGESAITSFTSTTACRLVDSACFANLRASDTPTRIDLSGRFEDTPKRKRVRSDGLVRASHSAQLDPSFGSSAGMSCAVCMFASYFYVAVCGSCTDGLGDARCPLHFMDGGPICEIPGHFPLVIRRHSPTVLLDLLQICEQAAGIVVDQTTLLRRFTGYMRSWQVDPPSENGHPTSLLGRLPVPENLRIFRPPRRGRGRGRGRPRKCALEKRSLADDTKVRHSLVGSVETTLIQEGPCLSQPLDTELGNSSLATPSSPGKHKKSSDFCSALEDSALDKLRDSLSAFSNGKPGEEGIYKLGVKRGRSEDCDRKKNREGRKRKSKKSRKSTSRDAQLVHNT